MTELRAPKWTIPWKCGGYS